MKSILKISIILLIGTIIIFIMNNEGPDGPIKSANNLFLGMTLMALVVSTTISLIEIKNQKNQKL